LRSGGGDSDDHGDVDQQDFSHFQQCLSGEGDPCLTACADSDFDSGADVDLVDFNSFEICFARPRPAVGLLRIVA